MVTSGPHSRACNFACVAERQCHWDAPCPFISQFIHSPERLPFTHPPIHLISLAHPPIYPSIHPPIYLSGIYSATHPCRYPFISIVLLYINLLIHPPSIYSSTSSPTRSSTCPSFHLPSHPPTHSSTHQPIYPPIHASTYPPTNLPI